MRFLHSSESRPRDTIIVAAIGALTAAFLLAQAGSALAGTTSAATATRVTATAAAATSAAATASDVDPSTIVSVANQNVGVGDSPASTSFTLDCNPYTALVGNPDGAGTGDCNRNTQFNVQNVNEVWCADFTKWVWEQGGVTADLSTLTPGAASFYTWGKDQGESMPTDPADPVPGDAVVFYPAKTPIGGTGADHVGIIVGVNSDGTVNLVNGDFRGSTNITVQADDNVNLAQWSAGVWHPGEQWIFVSPGKAGPQGGSRQASQAAAQADGTIDLFYRNTSNLLEHEVYTTAGGWAAPTQMGSEGVVGEPSVTTSSPGTVDVFWQGTNNDLWHQFYSPSSGWSAQQDMSTMGTLGGPPEAVAQVDGTVDVFWKGTGTAPAMWHAFYNPGSGWAGPQNLGGSLGSNPSPVTSTPGTVDVFYQGTDGNLWHIFYNPGSGWNAPANLNMGTLGGPPHATGQLDGTVDVFWKGTGTTPSMWHAFYNPGSGWAGPQNLGGSLGSDPMAVSSSPGTVDVFFQGTDGTLWHIFYNPGSGWNTAVNLNMGTLGGAPFASGKPNGTIDVFWKGTGTTPNLWHAWYSQGNGWAGPQNLGGSVG